MEPAEHVERLRREGTAVAAAVRRGGTGGEVPSCPGWTVADLVRHLGGVHTRFRLQVELRPDEPLRGRDMPAEERPPEDDGELAGWFEQGVERLADLLDATDPHDLVPTWSGRQPVRWVSRRMAQETAVHRWDAETAAGGAAPIDAALAADGIDELLEVFAPFVPPDRLDEPATMHLHATDAGLPEGAGEWMVQLGPERISFGKEHGKGDVAVRAPASDLLLLLWNRVSPEDDRYEIFGDRELIDRWRELLSV